MTETLTIKVERIHKLSSNGAVKAFVDLNVNDALVIKGIKVVDNKTGLFVSMPQEQGKDKKWYDTIRCLRQNVRDEISEKVMAAYNNHE